MRLHPFLLVVGLTGALALSACGGDDGGSSDTTAATTAAPADTTGAGTATPPSTSPTDAAPAVVASGFAFQTTPAAVGTITVRNDDDVPHTVTADDGSFDVSLEPGATATFTASAAGSFPFHCEIHSSMRGTLEVA